MPLYEYKCDVCKKMFNRYAPVDKRDKQFCECGAAARKLISCPRLITDTNFKYTGKVVDNLGPEPIEGRSDFQRRMDKEGLQIKEK